MYLISTVRQRARFRNERPSSTRGDAHRRAVRGSPDAEWVPTSGSNRSAHTLPALRSLASFALAFPLALAIGVIGPAPTTTAVSRAGAQSADVEFPSAGGLHLRGRQYGRGARWVILVHDEGEDSQAWRGLPGQLSARGLHVLAFDLRGYGASDGPRDARRVRADVAAALRFARSRGAGHLYVIGAGIGAGEALVAGTNYPIRAFVALSPRLSRSHSVRQTRAPKLIFVGSLDDLAAAQADAFFRRSIGFATLNSTPVAVQGTALLRSSWGAEVRELIGLFLRDYGA